MRASTLAGMAFTNADVAAVHCLSESIGGFYDLPHGKLNAILLEPVLRYSRPAIAERLAALDSHHLRQRPRSPQRERVDHFFEELHTLMVKLQIPPSPALQCAQRRPPPDRRSRHPQRLEPLERPADVGLELPRAPDLPLAAPNRPRPPGAW